jgi:hypothetical protein
MNIGATTGKEPNHIADEDLMTLDEMRGAMKGIHDAKLSLNQKATVEGCLTEIGVLKQQFAMQGEQMNRLIGMFQTLSGEFKQYREQRVIELQSWVAGGSTTPEDEDGVDAESGN